MKDVSQVTAGFLDYGLFIEMARVLGKTFKKVFYCNPTWPGNFPRRQEAEIGTGFDEIEVVHDIFEYMDDIDLLVYSDVGQGYQQAWLAEQGKAVWGCRVGEDLEFYRDAAKQTLESLGLPVGPYEVITGIDSLRKYLKENKDQIVKIDKWRGSFETFRSPNYSFIEPKLDEIERRFGPMKYDQKFVVEEELKDKFEAAIDAYNIDGKMPKKTLYGVEIKNLAYAARFVDYESIPKAMRLFDEKIASILKKYQYRSFYSPEQRIGKDKKAYMIDMCCRVPSPPNESYQVEYKNLADIIWQGANGICIDPIPRAKWVAEALIHSEWACKNFQPVEFPKEYEEFVKLRNCVKIKDKYYVVPIEGEMPEIGAVVGYGGTMDEAINMCKKISETVKGFEIEIKADALDQAAEEIDKAREYGAWPLN